MMKPDRIIAVRNRKTIYRDAELCLKVFAADYPKDDIFNEALNQARIEQTGLNIPKIHEIRNINGSLAIVSEFITGKSLASLMSENRSKRNEYLDLFINLQLKMHNTACPELCRLKDKLNRRICQTKLSATQRYDLHTRLDSMPSHKKLCHGDFDPSNIIITDSGEAYILDWSHAAQGNASADAARTYLLFWLHGELDTAAKYLELFCKKSGTKLEYVQKWMPIVAAAQLAKGNEKEREFLRSWINVVDYE